MFYMAHFSYFHSNRILGICSEKELVVSITLPTIPRSTLLVLHIMQIPATNPMEPPECHAS